MNLVGRQDRVLLASLAVALIVVFARPICYVLDLARDVGQSSGLALVPALIILIELGSHERIADRALVGDTDPWTTDPISADGHLHFKEINDRYGHLCSDAVLAALGARMQDVLRGSDLKCRYGGEEFLVLPPETPVEGAKRVAAHRPGGRGALPRERSGAQLRAPLHRIRRRIAAGLQTCRTRGVGL